MTRLTFGKRLVIYGGIVKLVCGGCRKEKLPDEFYRSGPPHPLHRKSACRTCWKQVYRSTPRKPSLASIRRARVKMTQEQRDELPSRPTSMATVAEARIRAARLAAGLTLDMTDSDMIAS